MPATWSYSHQPMDWLARPNFHLFPRTAVTAREASAPFFSSMRGARFEIAAGNSVDPHALSRVGVNAAATEQPTAVREVTVRNKQGIHARPSSQFVKIASRHPCEVFIEKDGEVINGKSIMGLLMLAAGPGSLLKIVCTGQGSEVALAELVALVENKFGEE
jgi:phosphocarrier protein